MHLRTRTVVLAALAVALSASLHAAEPATPPKMDAEQQAMMAAWQKMATPGPQHQQLTQQLVGSWDTKTTMWMDEKSPPMVEVGKATFTSVLDGRQVRQDFTGQVMGAPMTGLGYSGYDNARQQYTGVWTDNMSTMVMMATGTWDAAKKIYAFKGKMPDMLKPERMLDIRQTLRIVDADHMVMEMFEPHDGREVRTMQVDYTRTK